jgi:hypothetical protein
MNHPLLKHPEPPLDPALEATMAAVESHLAALGESLRMRDAGAIDLHATELHGALARAVEHFTHAARRGSVPPPLRRRLARATAALDRAIEVLIPREVPGLYSSAGSAERGLRGGVIQA